MADNSREFWKNNNINEILSEIIEPDAIDVKSLAFNDELNPLIWVGDKMKDDVRNALILNAKKFIEFSDLTNLKFIDIILTGSMANYNYNDKSDLDVHIILDFKQVSENEEFVDDYLKLKKTLWNNELPIQIKGHDVEMYLQDDNEAHHSTGTYSIFSNAWVNKPTKKIVNIDVDAIKSKTSDYMNQIDDLAKVKDSEKFLGIYNKIKDKIKKSRQSGLESNGEYSAENLAFKVLRNNGYLEKLITLKNEYLTRKLSLQ